MSRTCSTANIKILLLYSSTGGMCWDVVPVVALSSTMPYTCSSFPFVSARGGSVYDSFPHPYRTQKGNFEDLAHSSRTVKTQMVELCTMSLELPSLVRSGVFFCFDVSRGQGGSSLAIFSAPFLKWVILGHIVHGSTIRVSRYSSTFRGTYSRSAVVHGLISHAGGERETP